MSAAEQTPTSTTLTLAKALNAGLRAGLAGDAKVLLYGEDIVVVEQSGSKTALRRFIESVPAIGLFMAPF